MATVEKKGSALIRLARLKLRRDPDTSSGLRSPAATDKGDLWIDVSVAAVQTPTPTPRQNSKSNLFSPEPCLFSPDNHHIHGPRLPRRSKATNPDLRRQFI